MPALRIGDDGYPLQDIDDVVAGEHRLALRHCR
jgi:hypothetical protein